MSRIWIAVLLAALASGCATEAQEKLEFEAALQSVVGGRDDDLIREFGAPDSVIEMGDGYRMLEYSSRSQVMFAPSTMPFVVPISRNCILRFVVDPEDVIEQAAYEGSACY